MYLEIRFRLSVADKGKQGSEIRVILLFSLQKKRQTMRIN